MEENKYLLYSHYGIKASDSGSKIIYKAAKRSYLDFCRRVYIPNHIPMERRSALERETEKLLSDRIPALLETAGHEGSCQEAFDSRHQEICKAVIGVYDGVGGLSYGIAQRWLNLTLMNLAVIESNLKTGYWPIAEVRKYFHVPVERYLLEAAATWRKDRFQHSLGLQCAPLRHDNPDLYQMDWFSPGETQPFEYWGYSEYMEFQVAVRDKLINCAAYQDPLDWAFKAFLEVSQARNR